MLARHWLVYYLRIINPLLGVLFIIPILALILNPARRGLGIMVSAGVIPVNTQPVHFAPLGHLLLANNRNIVLTLTGYYASVTAITSGKVNRHAPLVHITGQSWPFLIGVLINLTFISSMRPNTHIVWEEIFLIVFALLCRLFFLGF